jgi:hypothetical protein
MLRRNLRLFTVIVCAALAALSCLLWATSDSRRDVFTCVLTDHRSIWLETVRGGAQLVYETGTERDDFQTGWTTQPSAEPLPSHITFGFGAAASTIPVWKGESARQLTIRCIVFPLWFSALLFAGAALWTWSRHRARHSQAGFEPTTPKIDPPEA